MKKTVIEAQTKGGAHSSLLTQRFDFPDRGARERKSVTKKEVVSKVVTTGVIQVIVITASCLFASVETLPQYRIFQDCEVDKLSLSSLLSDGLLKNLLRGCFAECERHRSMTQ